MPPTVPIGHPGPGWSAFSDPAAYEHYGLILVLATLSGAVLAQRSAQLIEEVLHDSETGKPFMSLASGWQSCCFLQTCP